MQLPVVNDCWNRIGVSGDGSCRELESHVHCRNCPVYGAASVLLLDRALPPDALREWTERVAAENRTAEPGTEAVIIFRIGGEWLALPVRAFQEVAEPCPIHTLPHRRQGALLGLVNVRGELLICAALEGVLGLEKTAIANEEQPGATGGRLLVLQRDGNRLACPVDEIDGVHRYHPRELNEVPATVTRAAATYTVGILPWQGKTVGCLDDELLFYSLNQSLA
jgi:chemotaxis-related protein WspD